MFIGQCRVYLTLWVRQCQQSPRSAKPKCPIPFVHNIGGPPPAWKCVGFEDSLLILYLSWHSSPWVGVKFGVWGCHEEDVGEARDFFQVIQWLQAWQRNLKGKAIHWRAWDRPEMQKLFQGRAQKSGKRAFAGLFPDLDFSRLFPDFADFILIVGAEGPRDSCSSSVISQAWNDQSGLQWQSRSKCSTLVFLFTGPSWCTEKGLIEKFNPRSTARNI